ncbi:hypothetical protein [Promicromonospora aerolata]|uniref:Uncharacterized protein n=1 Tax=Promicromonospora aerolata TaxID=195749 RepID=A0ABW4V534_9MICO
MSDEPTRRFPPVDDPTQIQRPDAPPSYAATQRMDPVHDGQGSVGYGDQTQMMPPAGAPQGGAGYGEQTQVMPPAGMPSGMPAGGDPGRDHRAATPPPARPYRPYETAQPTQVHAPAAFPGGPPQAYDQGYPPQAADQGYPPQAPRPTPPAPRRDRDDDPRGGGSAAGAVLAWIPRLLLALSVYQLVRLVPGFDVMPDVSQFPLFRGIGDGVLSLLNLDPAWSDQAADLTIPVLGIALAGLLNTIRSLSTSLAIWPYALAIIAWIVVFAVGGIVGYAQDATADMQEDVQQSVDEGIEDAKQDAKDSVEEQVEQGIEDALPGGGG